MTFDILGRFRRPLALAAVPAAVALGLGLTAASASAATTTPAYGHGQECDQTLTYQDQGYGYGHEHLVVVRDVCHVRIFDQGGYGRHHHQSEDVLYDTQRHGHLQSHFVSDVQDAQVFGY